MSRLTAIAPENAEGKSKELLETVGRKLGMVPNMMRTMANSPAVLEGYLSLSGALGHGKLSAKVREQIALAVAQANECDYCLAAHSAVGKMVGLTSEQIVDSRNGGSIDPGTDSLIRFARQIVETRGRVSDADVQAVRDAGFDEGAIAEVIAAVALDIFTNYFNIVADTEVDFPRAASLQQV
ncbi:carboxymuconolactone decarboxylase family protein [Blastopirellula marina]|uniref:Probable Mip n=1 Tax=Blastopirellula marina DSM 3645 TaxID=314230 RepID=A3ZSH1_9BACT|nr:carboxymuconolactone decarboxylase family protein [Blastopirellula marina]EAQ80631.1 probable Mip [Blastopirellula marina DSM 3645]